VDNVGAVWLRGPLKLPSQPIALAGWPTIHPMGKDNLSLHFHLLCLNSQLKPLICLNQFCWGWRQVAPGGHKCLPNALYFVPDSL
jgi:hypothetical protein